MLIDPHVLCSLIPHSGGMCLLDRVEQWDAEHIVCISHSHRDQENPLRSGGRLSAVHGIEYAAQTMAVHGGLLAREAERENPPGSLAAVRNVRFNIDRLDDQPSPLRIEAGMLMRGHDGFMYTFSISAAGLELLEGRLTVITGVAL